MTRRYTVLRNLAVQAGPATRVRTRRLAGPFEGIRANTTARGTPEPHIEEQSLDSHQVPEVMKTPNVTALAPIMRTSLIRPFAADAASAQDAWGIRAVQADTSQFTGEGVTIAVLDTGIYKDHAAFKNVGIDIVEQDFSGSGLGDRDGHGTHCAGTIFGRDVDGKRIGIARGVTKALIGKVLNDQGDGNSNMIYEGVKWAAKEGAHVISMSLGFDFSGNVKDLMKEGWPVELATSTTLEAYRANLRLFDALMQMVKAMGAFSHVPVVVAAAGNESKIDVNPDFKIAASLPAAAEAVISVGALQPNGDLFQVASFSNIFSQISAPGVAILSAGIDGSLRALSGTSMACPHVAGVAALWWESLRKSKAGQNIGALVVANLLAHARADVFAQHTEASDRGAGLVAAPQ